MTEFYKVLVNNHSCHGGTFDWTPYMPKGKRPGKWLPLIEDVRACSRGYHACTADQLTDWLTDGCDIFAVEYRDEPTDDGNKVVGGQCRVLRRIEHGERIGEVGVCDGEMERIDSGLWIVKGASVVGYVGGSATIGDVGDSATIGDVGGSATIGYVGDSATIVGVGGSAVATKYGQSAKVGVSGMGILIDRSQGGIKVYAAVPIEVVKA